MQLSVDVLQLLDASDGKKNITKLLFGVCSCCHQSFVHAGSFWIFLDGNKVLMLTHFVGKRIAKYFLGYGTYKGTVRTYDPSIYLHLIPPPPHTQDKTRQDKTRCSQDKATRHDKTRQDNHETRQHTTTQDNTRQTITRQYTHKTRQSQGNTRQDRIRQDRTG